ncbi:retrotransposon protein, putative, ty1-copia subclass [Tanacetum coccineum]
MGVCILVVVLKICNSVLIGLGERKLKQGAVYFYVSNGVRAQVEAIGSLNLVFPNGLVICSDNCHYAPTITRGVVSVYRLVDDGFIQRFTDSGILVSKNDVLYFNAIPHDAIYEIDMLNLVPNVNSIYNVSNKRAKINLIFTYLWHCCLAHISKKHIEKLQHDGLLKLTDDESFDQCISCLSDKMTRKLFPHRMERATDLLGLIHTDVCGPLRHVSRQEASGRAVELEEIQDEDTSPSKNTSENLVEAESFKPPEEDVAPVHPKSNKWLDAMNAEMQSMKDNQVWRLVDLPPNDIRAIRILIAIAAFYDYEIWQMDVKTAFLKGYLDEDFYMHQESWNKIFDEEIKRFGFAQNLDEPCIYQKANRSNVTFLILYVDDIIIMGNDIPMLQSVKSYLGKCFAMKDLGEAAFILGIKIYRDRSKRLIRLSQSAYMDKILKRFRMDNSKRGNIPMQERLDLNKTQGASTPKEVKQAEYIAASEAAMKAFGLGSSGWHLEKIHVTWTQFEKKRDKIATLLEDTQVLVYNAWRRRQHFS